MDIPWNVVVLNIAVILSYCLSLIVVVGVVIWFVVRRNKRSKTVSADVEKPVGSLVQPALRQCPDCGTNNPQENKFCEQCGTSLT